MQRHPRWRDALLGVVRDGYVGRGSAALGKVQVRKVVAGRMCAMRSEALSGVCVRVCGVGTGRLMGDQEVI